MGYGADTVGIGLIGAGRVATTFHLPALRRVDKARVIGIADQDPEQLDRTARQFDIPGRYEDYADLLARDDVGLVAVCVPPQRHVRVALDALEAGKHVLIEKPLALSLGECDQLIDGALRLNLVVGVGFNMRCHRLIAEMRSMANQGILGEPGAMRSAYTGGMGFSPAPATWRKQRQEGGGVLLEIGSHHFDAWRFLTGAEVEEIVCLAPPGRGPEGQAVVSARMSNGMVASGFFSEQTSNMNKLEMSGSAGRLSASCYHFDSLTFQPTGQVAGTLGGRARRAVQSILRLPAGLAAARQGGEWLASYAAEWRQMIRAIRDDGAPAASLADGRAALQIALAGIASLRSGSFVRVAEAPPTVELASGPATEASATLEAR